MPQYDTYDTYDYDEDENDDEEEDILGVCLCVILNFHTLDMSHGIVEGHGGLWFPNKCAVECFRKTLFRENQKYNPPRISQGVSLKGSKRIFDSDKV